jgi:hypothetical protein
MTDKCQIRQYSDETVCSYCGLRWDTNDRNPPACGQNTLRPINAAKRRPSPVAVKKGVIPEQRWEALKEAVKTGDWSKPI